jgi:membrane protease YdiL (CAAX protease family)
MVVIGVLAEFLFRSLADGMVLGRLTQKILAPAEALTLIVTATLLLRRHGETWRGVAFPTKISVRRTIALIFAGYFGVICINALLLFLVFPHLGVASPNLKAFASVKADLPTFLFWLAIAWSTAAVGEELLFRGFVWTRLERLIGGPFAYIAALVLQAVLFGLGHAYQGMSGVLATSAVGFVLGLVRLAARRNLLPGMLLHAMIDTVSLTAVFMGVVPKTMGV